jgi:DNA-binding beta-propeller fold protein YncE
LKRKMLLARLALGGRPDDLILKPDGGELYIPSSGTHGLLIVDTQTNEVGDFLLLGMSPAAATLTSDAQTLYVSDSAAGRVVPVAIGIRQAARPVSVGQTPGICRLTPGGDMLLVVDTQSDDLAVIRANAPTPSLITLVSTGSRPRDLAIKMF